MAANELRFQLGGQRRGPQAAVAYTILTSLDNDSPQLRSFRSGLKVILTTPRLGNVEIGGSFDRVNFWLHDIKVVIVVDFHNDMVYNWNLQITIPFPIMAKLFPQGEDPTAIVDHPLPTVREALPTVTQLNAPYCMIPIRFQVVSEVQGFGHRSRLGSIYRPSSESASIIRDNRVKANNRGDMPVQHLVNFMHHMVLQAQDGTYYAQSEASIVPVFYIGVDSRSPAGNHELSATMDQVTLVSLTNQRSFVSKKYLITMSIGLARCNVPNRPTLVEYGVQNPYNSARDKREYSCYWREKYNQSAFNGTTQHTVLNVKVKVSLIPDPERGDLTRLLLLGRGFSREFFLEKLNREINRQILLDTFQYMTRMLVLKSEIDPLPALASFHSRRTTEIFRKTMAILKLQPATPVDKRSPFYQKLCHTLQAAGALTGADHKHEFGPIYSYLQREFSEANASLMVNSLTTPRGPPAA